MTNEEIKKKIVEVLKDNTREAFSINGKSVSCYDIFAMQEAKINAIADALIAAGIGDVKEEKFESDHYWRMWQGSLVELERAEHRAARAKRALYKACKDIKDICEYLVKFGGTGAITIESYAPEQSEPQAYIERAEKELAEEKKE